MKPLMRRPDHVASPQVGSGPSRAAPCAPYGGACLGDACRHWFPLPTPSGAQEATCGAARQDEPIRLAEARRKLRRYAAYGDDCEARGDLPNAIAHRERAWGWAREVALLEDCY